MFVFSVFFGRVLMRVGWPPVCCCWPGRVWGPPVQVWFCREGVGAERGGVWAGCRRLLPAGWVWGVGCWWFWFVCWCCVRVWFGCAGVLGGVGFVVVSGFLVVVFFVFFVCFVFFFCLFFLFFFFFFFFFRDSAAEIRSVRGNGRRTERGRPGLSSPRVYRGFSPDGADLGQLSREVARRVLGAARGWAVPRLD